MKVLLYAKDQKIVTKSGVGEALRHQSRILDILRWDKTEQEEEGYDVVHINTIFPSSRLMSLRARRQGKKVVYYAHSTMEDFRNSFTGANLFAPLFKRWITCCYNSADVIITPTSYSKQLLESRKYQIRKPIYSLSNGIDTGFWSPDRQAGIRFRQKYGISADARVAISVGHYIDRKGILDFISMAEKMPETEFFWFGYTSLYLIPARIRRAIRKAPSNVHFPGYVNKDALKEAYCGSDVFLFLTKEETEGIVLLEALACGIPVLIRDIPIYRDWLWNGIDVYKGNTVEEFVELTREICNKTVPDLTVQGRRMAAERDFQKVARGLEQIYRESGLMPCSYVTARDKNSMAKALEQKVLQTR